VQRNKTTVRSKGGKHVKGGASKSKPGTEPSRARQKPSHREQVRNRTVENKSGRKRWPGTTTISMVPNTMTARYRPTHKWGGASEQRRKEEHGKANTTITSGGYKKEQEDAHTGVRKGLKHSEKTPREGCLRKN
jgi:hypothetical protein